MEKKTYYILTRDLEDPSTQGSGVLWGMTLLSNYVYGTTSPLALKGELFEALPADEQFTAVEDNVSLRGLKCPKEDLKMISGKEAYILLAVQSYSERCIIVNEKQSLLSWGVADNEGCQVSVWIDDMKKYVAAVIHYKGALPPYDGVMFGIEIVDPLFCNRGTTDGVFRCQRYFKCAAGAGMFVSLDKIRIPLCEEVTANAEAEENVQDDYTHITIDVYSFGLLLCEMCIRELPVPQKTDTQIFLMMDQDLRDLVMSCVRDKPKERPNMAEVLRELEQIGPAWRILRTQGRGGGQLAYERGGDAYHLA